MFFWPNLELTEYEKRFCGPYKTAKLPGVLRRTYRVLLNSTPFPSVPGLENARLEGAVQIARRSRIFGLTFSGDVHCWRLNISTASGETFTPRFAGGRDPIVTAMTPGVMFNVDAGDFSSPNNSLTITGGEGETESFPQVQNNILPLIIDPNWELSPNEQLIFRGSVPEGFDSVLEIGVHAWEFPGLVMGAAGPGACPPRMGAGSSVPTK